MSVETKRMAAPPAGNRFERASDYHFDYVGALRIQVSEVDLTVEIGHREPDGEGDGPGTKNVMTGSLVLTHTVARALVGAITQALDDQAKVGQA
jgi:hypothetical protein